jgi:hypothetical protein
MIIQDTPIPKQITFFESYINQYAESILKCEKSEHIRLWIEWIQGWNNEIIALKKLQENGQSNI